MPKKVVISRQEMLAKDSLQALTKAGFQPCHLPLISCLKRPIEERVSSQLARADWVFFTSALAVDFFKDACRVHLKIASLGHQTSLAIKRQGLKVDFQAESHYALDFVQEWLDLSLPAQLILLPQSSLSNPLIAQKLRQAGHTVIDWILYQTVSSAIGQKKALTYLQEEGVIWTFASPSAWASLYQLLLKTPLPASHKIAVIGKSTAKAVQSCGYRVDFMPPEPSVDAMIKTIIQEERE
ncbi:uroporphyrinogen-III synthase [Streptococcus catagoni]|uniref:uroporphyrinogen-III synthase n=1 Tax=Streptococcus catagoni TaxID=2654874 RepID=UPI00140A860D|nr:uroporphyrinogen-III synthase [Streptococcus catagoni]